MTGKLKNKKPAYKVKVICEEAISKAEYKLNEFLKNHTEIDKFSVHWDKDDDWVFCTLVWYSKEEK